MDKSILRQWLEAGFIEARVFHETNQGTPQGGVISPILANMVLDGLQQKIKSVVPRDAKVNFVRYADDFICTAKEPQILENIVKPTITDFMNDRGLELSKEKTLITHIDQGFDFLGYNIRKFDGTLLIRPAREKVKELKAKLKQCIRGLRHEKAHHVIVILNRILTGWANAFRNSCAKKIFVSIDHYVFQTIWRELKRRHCSKSPKWIKSRYFTSTETRNWIFFGVECKGERRRKHQLQFIGSRRIRRHVKVRSKAKSFDREWIAYFTNREKVNTRNRIMDRRTRFPTIGKWQRYPINQLELFAAGLRKQP